MKEGIEAPVLANQTLAAASAIFSWAINEEVGRVTANPCAKVSANEVRSRERDLSNTEFQRFWTVFGEWGIAGTALKLILLTGQRPGEVALMRREHIIDGWWEMPGDPMPKLGWPGTKNSQPHRVWLALPVQQLLGNGDGFVLAGAGWRPPDGLDAVMRKICKGLDITRPDKITPHDLRRTFATRAAEMGIGEDAIDRVLNHREKRRKVTKTYNRYLYAKEDRETMERMAERIIALAEGRALPDNIVQLSEMRA